MRDTARQSFVQRGVSREKDETCNQDPLAEDLQVKREDHSLLLAKGVKSFLGKARELYSPSGNKHSTWRAKEAGERKRNLGMIYPLMHDHTGT